MSLPVGAPLVTGELIHPRVESEIVFVIGEPLVGPGVTAARALQSVERVCAGLEIIDNRFTEFRFTLPDAVADNASAWRFAVGGRGYDAVDLDLALEACVLELHSELIDSADRKCGARSSR